MSKEITFEEFDKILWDWQCAGENVLIAISEPIIHMQVFERICVRIYPNDSIIIDSENGMASSLHLPIKKINKITQYNGNKILINIENMQIEMSILEGDSKSYTRTEMNLKWYGKDF